MNLQMPLQCPAAVHLQGWAFCSVCCQQCCWLHDGMLSSSGISVYTKDKWVLPSTMLLVGAHVGTAQHDASHG